MVTPAGPSGPDAQDRSDRGPLLPDVTEDEQDFGWGDRPSESDPDDVDRFLREVPPHHGS